jgi:DNA-binding NarL/FixJ family response regulator
MTPALRPRVLLADDYAGILTALRRLLEPSCDIVGSVENGSALLDAAVTLRPDVIVVDLAMPVLNGLDACRQIKDTLPDAKVVILTAMDEEALTEKAYSAGATAFVSKYRIADQLPEVVNKAFREQHGGQSQNAKLEPES